MKTITHEGQEYILKSEVDGIVRERLSKVTENKRSAEKRVQELESQLEDMSGKVKGAEAMASQLATLQDELAVSNQRYERHQAIASQGITDPEVRDLVEWQYNKAMDSKAKKDRIPMGEWMATMKEGGEVPTVLKPYFQAQEGTQNAPQEHSDPNVSQDPVQKPAEPAQSNVRPSTNQGVATSQNHTTNGNLWSRASSDYDFFKQNRAELKKQYYDKRKNRFRQ